MLIKQKSAVYKYFCQISSRPKSGIITFDFQAQSVCLCLPSTGRLLLLLHVNAFIFFSDHDLVTQWHSCSPYCSQTVQERNINMLNSSKAKVSDPYLHFIIKISN